ncbi:MULTISPECIES: EMC6-like membrane protein [unclassified Haladaptatus]|uniref:EMC6-like membrane protein n=1 Tax=unclassified Haladaptatus TaxID=2622732 RepID=UPI002FCDEB3D
MATETLDRRKAHMRGVTVTSVSALAGVAGAIISAMVATGPQDTTAVFALVGAILVQLPLLRLLGIDVQDFSTKDYLYVGFMTFSLWFVSWTLLLQGHVF